MNRRLVVGGEERAGPELLGGKGHGLQALTAAGVRVPAWFALTTEAMDRVLARVRWEIDERARTVPRGDATAARAAAERIAELVEQAPWDPALCREMEHGLRALRTDRGLAVRSSAVGEDGAASSHAGQLATFLHVGTDGLQAAVRQCWAAAFSERAILYRQARGLEGVPVRGAVVIQELVDARVSGVAFTADPLTGAPAHVVVAGPGLGDGVVSDRVETDTYVRDFDGDSWRATVRRKTRRVVPRRGGTPGIAIEDMPLSDQDLPALTVAELDALSATLARIEAAAGRPQDVEWAIDHAGALHILQARPISPAPDGDLAIWDDSNIGESYPGLTLPLTYSYVRLVYERLFGHALRLAGVPRHAIESLRPALAHLIGPLRGRLYFNLWNYYRLFLVVPGLDGTVRKWETALGVTRHVDFSSLRAKGFWRRTWRWLLSLRTAFFLGLRLLRLRADVRRFHARADEMLRRYDDADFDGRPFTELWRIYERITADYLDPWVLLIYNDLFAFLFDDRLAQLCDRHEVLAGLVRVESIAPLRSVLGLIEAARRAPEVTALLRSNRPASEVWAALASSPAGATFRAGCEAHLRRYGQRSIEELKFEVQSLADTPAVLVEILRNHLSLGLDAGDLEARERGAREAAERAFRRQFRWNPGRRAYARWVRTRTLRCIADRENMSYARCRAYGVLRRLFRAMGEALNRTGALMAPADVFYLTLADLDGYLHGDLPDGDLAALVDRRKAQYALFAGETLPHRIVCRGPVYPHRALREGTASRPGPDGVLQGVPCSPGRVRGVARVVRTPSPGERFAGEILVAPVTEPGWIFLMLAARGIVVERGSVLSHAAIVGRELGVPTVVGVEGATRWITSGDEVELDGATGRVRILRRA